MRILWRLDQKDFALPHLCISWGKTNLRCGKWEFIVQFSSSQAGRHEAKAKSCLREDTPSRSKVPWVLRYGRQRERERERERAFSTCWRKLEGNNVSGCAGVDCSGEKFMSWNDPTLAGAVPGGRFVPAILLWQWLPGWWYDKQPELFLSDKHFAVENIRVFSHGDQDEAEPILW